MVLKLEDWSARAKDHFDRMCPWVEEYRARRARGLSHPVTDFLFIYYSFRPGQLMSWSPGLGVALEGTDVMNKSGKYWVSKNNITNLDLSAISGRQKRAVLWICELMNSIASKPPLFRCYGLHEWAMVYRLPASELRHSQFPLRLSSNEVSDFLDEQNLCCSHYDAIRFFAPEARVRNISSPALSNRIDFEQPGCLHTNMDLYKWSYKMSPWIPSEILADSFLLAAEIRELDMRASPYDLTSIGFDPVTIETTEGRKEYERLQRDFSKRAKPIRDRLHVSAKRLATALNLQ